ncbi:MAG: ribosome silencing factor [Ignavibacterium sp.]|nr:MAG: ribosome silencing factor [Ignavibacterium sp.]
MDSNIFAKRITEIMFNKKAYDVLLIDLRKLTAFADYFVICSADSDVQVKAIADDVDRSLRDEGMKCWHKEGYQALNWVLLDYVDVVVHVFKRDAREFYNLEKLWGDARFERLADPAQSQSVS